jgi:hypothetical protein
MLTSPVGANKPIEDIEATLLEGHKVARVGVGLTAYGRRSKSGETPDGAAYLTVA